MNEKIIDIQVVAFEKDGEINFANKLNLHGEGNLIAEALGNILTLIGEHDMGLLNKILAEHRKSFERVMMKKGDLEE